MSSQMTLLIVVIDRNRIEPALISLPHRATQPYSE